MLVELRGRSTRFNSLTPLMTDKSGGAKQVICPLCPDICKIDPSISMNIYELHYQMFATQYKQATICLMDSIPPISVQSWDGECPSCVCAVSNQIVRKVEEVVPGPGDPGIRFPVLPKKLNTSGL